MFIVRIGVVRLPLSLSCGGINRTRFPVMLRRLPFVLVLACADLPSQGGPAALANHVQDWRDEVIYQVIIDRFADGDINNDFSISPGVLGRYQGGDWKGVEDHLQYLQALGVTTLWISPSSRTSTPTPASTRTTATGRGTSAKLNKSTSGTRPRSARWSPPRTTRG